MDLQIDWKREASMVMTINNDKQAIPAKLSIFRFLFSFLGIDLFGRKALNTKIIPGKFNKSRNTGPMNNMLVMKSTETKINDQTGLYTLHNFVDVVAV